MGIFNRSFTKKDAQVEIVKRLLAIEKFNNNLELMGFNSFKLQVGNEAGAYMDTVFINSKTKGNEDVGKFLAYSILKKHTSANLMSIGFKYAGVIEGNVQRSELFNLSEYAK